MGHLLDLPLSFPLFFFSGFLLRKCLASCPARAKRDFAHRFWGCDCSFRCLLSQAVATVTPVWGEQDSPFLSVTGWECSQACETLRLLLLNCVSVCFGCGRCSRALCVWRSEVSCGYLSLDAFHLLFEAPSSPWFMSFLPPPTCCFQGYKHTVACLVFDVGSELRTSCLPG